MKRQSHVLKYLIALVAVLGWLLTGDPASATTAPASVQVILDQTTPMLVRVGEAFPLDLTLTPRTSEAQIVSVAITLGPGLIAESDSLPVREGGAVDVTARILASGAQQLDGVLTLPAAETRSLRLVLHIDPALPTHSLIHLQTRPHDAADATERATGMTLFVGRTAQPDQVVLYRAHELTASAGRAGIRTLGGTFIPLLTGPDQLRSVPSPASVPARGSPQRTVIVDLDAAPTRAAVPILMPITQYQEEGVVPSVGTAGTELTPPQLVTP